MKSGRIFKEFITENAVPIVLRAPKWEDLEITIEYARNLAEEARTDPEFGIPFDSNWTPETETKWLADTLVRVELDEEIAVFALAERKLAGVCVVIKKKDPEFSHYGRLGISVAKEYRDIGVGFEMVTALTEECRKNGMKLIDLGVFANNLRAIHLYEKVGFQQVGRTPGKRNRNGRFIDDISMVIEL